jgi:ribosomal protein S27AE
VIFRAKGTSLVNFILISWEFVSISQKKWFLSTFSRCPNCGASTVMKRPWIPRRSACTTIRFVTFLSLLTYLKNIYGLKESEES